MSAQHVAIVGGGIVGCMTAMELVQRGYKVTIVERNQIASQTSGESSWAGAGILFPLLPWMYSQHVNVLTSYGAKAYQKICHDLTATTGLDTGFEQSGFLLLPPFNNDEASSWCENNHILVQSVKAAAFGVNSLSGEDALWLPTVCQVRPPFLMQALRHWLSMHHVKFLEHTQLEPLHETTNLKQWRTLGGELIEADKYIVTSGAWSFELLKETTKNLNIKPMRGQILLYHPEKNLEQMVYRDGFYMVPRQDGFLLAGSTLEDVGFDASTTEAVRDEISAKAEAIMPALKGSPIIKHWAGLRPGTPENLPMISAHPTIQNLYLNTGHFRYGLTMAPASAKLVADLVCGTDPWLDPTPYQLSA